MSIAKMSALNDSYRCFTIAVHGYENLCLRGIACHGKEHQGVCFNSLMEMVLYMNQKLDEMSCPKQTMELRTFSGASEPFFETEGRLADPDAREKAIAVFTVKVKYRYNTSWQGVISWLEGGQTETFESLLSMIQWMNQWLTGKRDIWENIDRMNTCQVSLDSYENRTMKGHIQNVWKDYLQDFISTTDMANRMFQIFETGFPESSEQVISEQSWNQFRKGGEKATFVVKILFREHSTWQGIIFWKERKENQVFRSFLEMMILMASAVESLEATSDQTCPIHTLDSIDDIRQSG